MKRVLMLVEGQTEERFVKDVLQEHFWAMSLDVTPTILKTKHEISGSKFRGGLSGFGKFENDLRRLLFESKGNALVTMMLDYYRLPEDFPGMTDRPVSGARDRIQHVERKIHQHFGSLPNFLPHLSLHEFETLLFCSPAELSMTLTQPNLEERFAEIRAAFATPEDINETPNQSPSKRIETVAPFYRKTLHGPSTTKRIGLKVLRAECPHFSEWLSRLETYARSS
jgi:Domain of unknown function (DUF4276)